MTKLRLESHSNDIEECVTSGRLYHSDSYHKVLDQEKARVQTELLSWYHLEKRTTMPWRKDNDKTWDQQVKLQLIILGMFCSFFSFL